MSKIESLANPQPSLGRDIFHAARYHLGGRRGLVVLAAAVIIAGLTFKWSWLAAAGIAPVLLSLLPCVAMCALGLCMSRMTGRSCAADAASQKPFENAAADEPSNGSRRQIRDSGLPALEE
jgi:hypothetical protein